MNTSSSPSPSIFGAIWGLVAFVFYPILSLIWMEKCNKRDDHHSGTFALLACLGVMAFLIALVEIVKMHQGVAKTWLTLTSLSAYLLLAYGNLLLISRVQKQCE
jgi:hypothetical protein